MTFELLNKLIEENDIPKDVHLQSDSGWECDETEMDGVWYNRETNTMIFTQYGDEFDDYMDKIGWELIYSDYGETFIKIMRHKTAQERSKVVRAIDTVRNRYFRRHHRTDEEPMNILHDVMNDVTMDELPEEAREYLVEWLTKKERM